MDVEKEMDKLEKMCEPLRKYLIEKYNPYVTISVTYNGISVKQEKIWIPINSCQPPESD